jgi:hypothetical protein
MRRGGLWYEGGVSVCRLAEYQDLGIMCLRTRVFSEIYREQV